MKTYYQAIKDLADDFISDYGDEIREIIKENKEKTEEEIVEETVAEVLEERIEEEMIEEVKEEPEVVSAEPEVGGFIEGEEQEIPVIAEEKVEEPKPLEEEIVPPVEEAKEEEAVERETIVTKPPQETVPEVPGLKPRYTVELAKIYIKHGFKEKAEDVLKAIKRHPYGKDAVIIGKVEEGKHVIMETSIGGRRIVEMPIGDPIPRIC